MGFFVNKSAVQLNKSPTKGIRILSSLLRAVGYALPKYGSGISTPDLSYHQGHFYIYYETRGSNRVIVADRIEGPWSKPVDLHLPHIDPCPIVTPEGKR